MSGYPLASVLAEKLVTMLEFRQANTRDRDVGDIVRIIATHTIDCDELLSACRASARYRDIHLEPLAPTVSGLATRRQASWSRWRVRMGLQDERESSHLVAMVTGGTGRGRPVRQRWG